MKTCLYDQHLALKAKMVDFAGWQMPISYESALKEHLWVRENAGLFDISHMAKIWIEGPKSEEFLNYIATNQVDKLADKKAQYTVLCDEKGMCVDDVIIYRENAERYFVVVNASNREKDLAHFVKYGKAFDVTITPNFQTHGIVALQGPKSKEIISQFFDQVGELKFMCFDSFSDRGVQMIVARTGYTGEHGYEIYGDQEAIVELWMEILYKNQDIVKPIGLAARDTLRLEMGYALYGHELTDQISPLESIASWVVKWKESDFLGKEALKTLKEQGAKRSQHAILLEENAIARPGCAVLVNGEEKAIVTSGGYSPTLKRSIALIMAGGVLKESDKVGVLIRDREIEAKVVKLPFIEKA